MSVDLLILGAGWTSTFLIPLCEEHGTHYAVTSRTGEGDRIPFTFDSESDDHEPYRVLPDARTVLITFPILTNGASQRLVTGYKSTRRVRIERLGFMQLGATSIWDKQKVVEGGKLANEPWCDRHSSYNKTPRAISEDELLALSPETPTTVLNLAGLWGGQRSPRNWVERIAPTKDALGKKGSVHFIHGIDVARAIHAVHKHFSRAQGQRWILTDGRVYDWWDLASAWGTRTSASMEQKAKYSSTSSTMITIHADETYQRGPQPDWVKDLMEEHRIRALPRNIDLLGRAFDSRDFWKTFGLFPVRALLEGVKN